MPSPFPGMNPTVEAAGNTGRRVFHHSLADEIKTQLNAAS